MWKQPQDLLQAVMPLLGYRADGYDLEMDQSAIEEVERLPRDWQELKHAWIREADDINDFLMNSSALNRNRVRKPSVSNLMDQVSALFQNDLPWELPEKWDLLTTGKLNQCLKNNCQDNRIQLTFFTLAESFAERHQQWSLEQKKGLLIETAEYVIETVELVKQSHQTIGFDDLVKRVKDKLSRAPRSLIERITSLYPLAMVDEFQDTDFQQYHIFFTLYGHIRICY